MSDLHPPPADLTGLIAQARRRAANDPRHALIWAFLQCLVPRRAFGPRFGDGNYKSILECNYEE